MDSLHRSRRLLLRDVGALTVALAACSPAKGEPVGVSHDRAYDAGGAAEADAGGPAPLAGLPADFRTTWARRGKRVASEHGRFVADVYENAPASWAEDLFVRDAGAGAYLLERGDAGVRFAVADARGRAVADSAADAGPSLEACARCHAGAPGGVFPVVP